MVKTIVIFPVKHVYRERLGIMYLASTLKQAGFPYTSIDANTNAISNKLMKYSRKYKNIILAYSFSTPEAKWYLSLNRKIKSLWPNIISVTGGPHSTFCPEQVIADEGVDILCRGEGEEVFLELVNCIDKGEDFTRIHNLWVKIGEKVVKNPTSRICNNLDKLPFPDRTILNTFAITYKAHSVIGSRGCIYNCSYCSEEAFFTQVYGFEKGYIRYRSIDNILEEIEEIQRSSKPRLGAIAFWDSLFFNTMDRLENFSIKYAKHFKIPFQCGLPVTKVNEDVAYLLARAGCMTVNLGVESGSKYIRENMLKRYYSNKKIIEAVEILKKYNINVQTFNILSLPHTNIKHDYTTILLNAKIKPTYAFADFYLPIPKTKLYEKYKENLSLEIYDKFSSVNFSPYNHVYNNTNKKIMLKLYHLFPILVKYPFLIPLSKKYINYIPSKLLRIIHKFYFIFYTYFVLRPFYLKDWLNIINILKGLKHLLRLIITL